MKPPTSLIIWSLTVLVASVRAYSEYEDDADIMQNDPEVGLRLESLRSGRGRVGGYVDALHDEMSLTREERKRLKAERRRLKEERRQERQARRRQHKQAGQRDAGDLGEEMDDADLYLPSRGAQPQVVRPAASGDTSGPSTSAAGQDVSSVASATDAQPVTSAPMPEVVDLEWMRANLSSLWSIVRTLYRQQQVRPFLTRGGGVSGGGRGRHHHHSGLADAPDPVSCPGTEDACRGDGGHICGGQGMCSCGNCFCHPGYYGTFCQCNDHTCPLYDGMTCGGPSRGQCRCGGCVCRPGYTGDSCDCPTDTQTCFPPGSEDICSGKGTCECGRCKCSDGHKGMYCEDTVYAAGVCEKLKSCVMCRAWNRDLPSCANCQITVTTVESLEPSMTTCVLVNSGCLLQFSYIPQTTDAYTVLVPRDMACPTT